jgi:hypothetical protein
LICLHEYLTDQTLDKIIEYADPHFAKELAAKIRLPVSCHDPKKNHEKLVESITALYWFEELEIYADITKSDDLPETGNRIFSHWFFVDEAEHLSELASTEYFVRVCMGISEYPGAGSGEDSLIKAHKCLLQGFRGS